MTGRERRLLALLLQCKGNVKVKVNLLNPVPDGTKTYKTEFYQKKLTLSKPQTLIIDLLTRE